MKGIKKEIQNILVKFNSRPIGTMTNLEIMRFLYARKTIRRVYSDAALERMRNDARIQAQAFTGEEWD